MESSRLAIGRMHVLRSCPLGSVEFLDLGDDWTPDLNDAFMVKFVGNASMRRVWLLEKEASEGRQQAPKTLESRLKANLSLHVQSEVRFVISRGLRLLWAGQGDEILITEPTSRCSEGGISDITAMVDRLTSTTPSQPAGP